MREALSALGTAEPDATLSALCTSAGRALGADIVWISRAATGVVEQVHVAFDSDWTSAEARQIAAGVAAAMGDPTQTVVVRDTGLTPATPEVSVARHRGLGSLMRTPVTLPGAQPSSEGRVLWAAARATSLGTDDADQRLLELVAETIGSVSGAASTDTAPDLTPRIEQALRGGQLRMVFQPIVSLGTAEARGVEALARFRDGRRPDLWFAEAEAAGLGTELELLAVGMALSSLDRLPDHLYLSVNASPRTIVSPAFHDLVEAVDPTRVVLEMTEHARVDDYDELTRHLDELRRLGARLAVDDVGAGFSSFAHVLELRPDLLKLDISITRGIDTDPARRALARGLVSVARDIGAEVVAEGIETLGELNSLLDVGIAAGQGYFLARPGDLPIPTDFPLPTNRVLDDRGRPISADDLLAYVTQSWIRAHDLESVARSFLKVVQARTGLQTSYLTIVDPDTGALDHRYVYNAGPIDLPEGIVIPWSDTLCSRARAAGIRWTPDVPNDLPGCEAAEAFGVRTFLSVPVTRPDGTVAGTLCAASTEVRGLGEAVIDEIELMARLLGDRIDGDEAELPSATPPAQP